MGEGDVVQVHEADNAEPAGRIGGEVATFAEVLG